MDERESIVKLVDEMNEKSGCIIKATFADSSFEFDVSNQTVMCVLDEHNFSIVVALGQSIIYSVDLLNAKLKVIHLEDTLIIELKDVDTDELRGAIMFAYI